MRAFWLTAPPTLALAAIMVMYATRQVTEDALWWLVLTGVSIVGLVIALPGHLGLDDALFGVCRSVVDRGPDGSRHDVFWDCQRTAGDVLSPLDLITFTWAFQAARNYSVYVGLLRLALTRILQPGVLEPLRVACSGSWRPWRRVCGRGVGDERVEAEGSRVLPVAAVGACPVQA